MASATIPNLVFSTDLYTAVSSVETGNFFISPTSIQAVLTLLYIGARGNTASQLSRALRLNQAPTVRHSFDQLPESGDHFVNVANKLYVNNNVTINSGFQQAATAGGFGIEYFSKLDQARYSIIEWVNTQTNTKLRDIFPEGNLDSESQLVVVNTNYIDSKWNQTFTSEENGQFFVTANQPKSVTLLNSKRALKYAEIAYLSSKVLLLPMEGLRLSVLFILPSAIDGLQFVEQLLPSYGLETVISELGTEHLVDLHLPKFNLAYVTDLRAALEKLNVTDIFTNHADLQGISESRPKVDKLIINSYVQIDKGGSEIAALGDAVLRRVRSTEEKTFRADHPFLFYILDVQRKVVYFEGRFKKP